jgi:cephalosporin-C deacetylase-like acetyl esterase
MLLVLHRDLQVDVVTSEIQRFAQKHEERLHHHEKVEAIQLLDNTCIVRRLQRGKTFSIILSDSVNAVSVTVLV